MIVVDASAMLEVLLRTPAAPAIEERRFEGGATLHAPHLIDLEVVQVLRRYAAAGEISAKRARRRSTISPPSVCADGRMSRLPYEFGTCGKT